MKNFQDMTPEQRLDEIKARFYRDHVGPDGREQLIMAGDSIPTPQTRAEPGEDDQPGIMMLDGYAAVFDMDSQGLWFTERVAPGAFKSSILTDDVVALFNHDKNFVLGRTSSGTLELAEDPTGLKYEIKLPNTTAGRDVHESVGRRDVNGSSFSFQTIKDQWEYLDDGETVKRTLLEVKVFDVGPVTFPAYPSTSTHARSMDTFIKEVNEKRDGEKPWRVNIARRALDLAQLT